MKTIKIISVAVVILMMTGIASFAKGDNKSVKKNELNGILTKEVKYPLFAKERALEGDVYVLFTVNNEGKIEIDAMNYMDVELGDYVKECLNKIVINKNDIVPGKPKAIKFEFKLL